LTGVGTSISTFTTGSWFNTLSFGSTVFTIAATSLNLNGLTLSTGAGVYTNLTANMRGTGTINCNGKSTGPLIINNDVGTTTLAAAALCTTFTMTAGTINFATFNLTCSSTATYTSGTLSSIGTITCTTFTVNVGTFTLTQGTITPSVSFVVSGSGTFNYNGGTLSAVPTFTHSQGTVTLGQAYALTATGTYTLSAGTLALGTSTLTTGIFNSTGGSIRSINFGTGNIALATTTAAQTVLSMANASNFTYTGTGGFTSNMSTTRTFTFGTSSGGASTNAPNLTLSGASIATLTTASYFNKLDFTTSTFNPGTTSLNLNGLTLSNGVGAVYTTLSPTMVGTGTITSSGNTTLTVLTINSTSGTTTLGDAFSLAATGVTTLTTGTLALADFTLTTGQFSSSNANTRSVNFGTVGTGSIALTHTTAATTVLSMAIVTGFTYTGTGAFTAAMDRTRIFVFGTTGGTATNAPNLTLSSGSSVATLTTGSWFNTLSFGSTVFTIAATSLNLNGLTLSTGAGVYTNLIPTMVGTGSINTNGKSLTTLTINHAGTTTLASSVTTSTSTTLTSGTLALAGFTLTPTQFISGTAATRAISGAGISVISISNDWTVTDGTGFTGSDYTINMTKATAKTFAGAGGSYGTLVQAGAGALTISGSNTLADIQATTRPSTITFTAGTTQTVSAFTLEGTIGNLVTINSTTVGSYYTLSKASGTVTVSYLSIRDSIVSGGASWFDNNGTNTVIDTPNFNLGWNPVYATINNQFFAFF